MRSRHRKLLVVMIAAVLAVPLFGQIYRYYHNSTVWSVTLVRIEAGKDPAYLEYLDGEFRKQSEAKMKAKILRSYKILRTLDNDYPSWNMLIMREYDSLASLEANEEKLDLLDRQVAGDLDAQQMQGYEERAKVRQVIGTRTMRELILK